MIRTRDLTRTLSMNQNGFNQNAFLKISRGIFFGKQLGGILDHLVVSQFLGGLGFRDAVTVKREIIFMDVFSLVVFRKL